MTDNMIWGADTVVSMPVPLRKDQTALVDMGGFTFTAGGIAHDISESDVEVYLTPTFRPLITPEVM
jgi:hypothetical protein